MSRTSHVQFHECVAWSIYSNVLFTFLFSFFNFFFFQLSVDMTVTFCCNQSLFACFIYSSKGLFLVSLHLSMLVSLFNLSFRDTLNIPISSCSRKALRFVIHFPALRFICLNLSLIHFKKGPEYLTRKAVQVFIPWMRLRKIFIFFSGVLLSFFFFYSCLLDRISF